jgi:hypothetical protein
VEKSPAVSVEVLEREVMEEKVHAVPQKSNQEGIPRRAALPGVVVHACHPSTPS